MKYTTGLFLFNKPVGPSSAQFLSKIKRAHMIPKGIRVGHGGTLDPFASGLLIVGIGREFTQQLHTVLKDTQKSYRATVIIGAVSDTLDSTGVITNVPLKKDVVMSDVEFALAVLQKNTEQVPPQFSAVKLEGKPAYERARAGEEFVIQPKLAQLYSYTVHSFSALPQKRYALDIELNVSSGYYIRSFARDLGELLGSGGYVESLVRTRIANFSLSDAQGLEEPLQASITLKNG